MKTIVKVALVAAASAALSGCATVMNGTSQDIAFDSAPGGATVKVTTGATCMTPCKLELKRGKDLRADFNKSGYKPAYVLVQSKLGGATFANVLAGGIVGAVVDGSNGASNHLSPNPVNVRLVADGATGEAVLFDKKGKDGVTVQSHNDGIRSDVAGTLGAEAAGIVTASVAPVSAAKPADFTAAATLATPPPVEAAPAAETAAAPAPAAN